MKVERINDNKIKITLTFEELEKRKISLTDIEKDASLAKELFIDLIEESSIADDFEIDDTQLFIEASSDNNNLFIVTITRIDNIPELKKYSLFEENKQNYRKKSRDSKRSADMYKVSSSAYLFNSIDEILDLCEASKQEKIFWGKNSLFKYNDKYFLVFSNSTMKSKKFLKSFVFLSEFCKEYYSYDMFVTSIKEKSQLIIENTALQKLSKI